MALLSGRPVRLFGAALLIGGAVAALSSPADAAEGDAYLPVVAAVPVGTGPADLALDSGNDTAYVTNGSDGTVSAVDETTDTVVATIAVGEQPVAVAVDPSLHTVYVANSGDDTVSVIDDRTNEVTGAVLLAGPPTAIAVDPHTHTVYTSDRTDGSVSALQGSPAAGYRSSVIAVPAAAALAVDPGTSTVYVLGRDGTSVIDEASNTVTATIPVSGNDLALDPVAGTVFVADAADATTSVIDEATGTVTATFAFAYYQDENFPPYAIAVDPGSRNLYLTDGSTSLYVLDETTGAVVGSAGSPADGQLAVDPDTHAVYVASGDLGHDPRAGTVSVIAPKQVPRPSISATLSYQAGLLDPSVSVPAGTPVSAAAVLSGPDADTASGVVYYEVYSTDTCGTPVKGGNSVQVADGVVPPSAPIALDPAGTYYWQAVYSGDETHAPAATPCDALPETVSAAPVVTSTFSADLDTRGSTITAPAVHANGAGNLLIAMIEADGPAAPVQTVTGVSGGGLTWTPAARANQTYGDTEIWQAYAPGYVDADVSATLAYPDLGSITVAVVRTPATRVSNAVALGSTGGPARVGIRTNGPGSLVLAAGHDWSRAVTISPVVGQSLLHFDRDAEIGASSWTQRLDAPTQAATQVAMISRGPVDDDHWSMAAVAIPAG